MNYIGYIYKITCLINNRCYVGQHRKPQFDEKYWGSGNNIDYKNDLKNYGKDNFKREVLYWATTQDELNKKEMDFIISENALTSFGGYNLWINREQKEWTPEVREKFNKNFYKVIHSSEYKEKQRKLSTGRKFSKESKQKLSNSLKNSERHHQAIRKVTSSLTYKQNMSNSIKNSEKHKRWYTNPELRKIRYENPEIRKKISEGTSKAQIGKHWFTNGIINVFRFECPEGFKPGRTWKIKR